MIVLALALAASTAIMFALGRAIKAGGPEPVRQQA
jgi:hypothetical protein